MKTDNDTQRKWHWVDCAPMKNGSDQEAQGVHYKELSREEKQTDGWGGRSYIHSWITECNYSHLGAGDKEMEDTFHTHSGHPHKDQSKALPSSEPQPLG